MVVFALVRAGRLRATAFVAKHCPAGASTEHRYVAKALVGHTRADDECDRPDAPPNRGMLVRMRRRRQARRVLCAGRR